MASPLRRSPRTNALSQGDPTPSPPSQSATSLGKRRAVSPPPALAPPASKQAKLPSARRLRSSATELPSLPPMSTRKGSRASRAAKAKARALDDSLPPHDAESGPSSATTHEATTDLEMNDPQPAPAAPVAPEKDGDDPMEDPAEPPADSEGNDGETPADNSDSSPDEDDDDHDDEDEDDEEDQDNDDDLDEEEEAAAQAHYEAELRAQDEHDLANLLDRAAQGFGSHDDPAPSSSPAHPSTLSAQSAAALEAAMDAAEDQALDAAAARQYLAGMGGSAGAGFRALHGMMSGMSARLKGILALLRSTDGDASAKLAALQDLAELLSVSTEDTLAGSFQVEAFTKEIVTILKGDNIIIDGAGGDEEGGMTAAEMLAFGIEPGSQGGGDGGSAEESNVQMMLLACRCLANLMEALPGSAHSVVYAGAVPVLCSKLQDIQYIDLAEQTLSVSL